MTTLEIFPCGEPNFYFLGSRVLIATANGKEKSVIVRDERFGARLRWYEAEWLLRNEGNEMKKGKVIQ